MHVVYTGGEEKRFSSNRGRSGHSSWSLFCSVITGASFHWGVRERECGVPCDISLSSPLCLGPKRFVIVALSPRTLVLLHGQSPSLHPLAHHTLTLHLLHRTPLKHKPQTRGREERGGRRREGRRSVCGHVSTCPRPLTLTDTLILTIAAAITTTITTTVTTTVTPRNTYDHETGAVGACRVGWCALAASAHLWRSMGVRVW